VPEVKSTLIKSRCGSDIPPTIPDDKSVIELREGSYDCSGRSESKEIDRLTQPPKQHHTAISVVTLSRAARFGRLKSGVRYVTCLSSSSAPAVRAPALAGRRRPRGATPGRLADSVRCHMLWQPIQTGTHPRKTVLSIFPSGPLRRPLFLSASPTQRITPYLGKGRFGESVTAEKMKSCTWFESKVVVCSRTPHQLRLCSQKASQTATFDDFCVTSVTIPLCC